MSVGSDSKSSKCARSIAPYARWMALSLLVTPWGLAMIRVALLDPIRLHPPVWLRLLLGVFVAANYRSLHVLDEASMAADVYAAVTQL